MTISSVCVCSCIMVCRTHYQSGLAVRYVHPSARFQGVRGRCRRLQGPETLKRCQRARRRPPTSCTCRCRHSSCPSPPLLPPPQRRAVDKDTPPTRRPFARALWPRRALPPRNVRCASSRHSSRTRRRQSRSSSTRRRERSQPNVAQTASGMRMGSLPLLSLARTPPHLS